MMINPNILFVFIGLLIGIFITNKTLAAIILMFFGLVIPLVFMHIMNNTNNIKRKMSLNEAIPQVMNLSLLFFGIGYCIIAF